MRSWKVVRCPVLAAQRWDGAYAVIKGGTPRPLRMSSPAPIRAAAPERQKDIGVPGDLHLEALALGPRSHGGSSSTRTSASSPPRSPPDGHPRRPATGSAAPRRCRAPSARSGRRCRARRPRPPGWERDRGSAAKPSWSATMRTDALKPPSSSPAIGRSSPVGTLAGTP